MGFWSSRPIASSNFFREKSSLLLPSRAESPGRPRGPKNGQSVSSIYIRLTWSWVGLEQVGLWYVPAPRLARLMPIATQRLGPTSGTVSTRDMFFSKATGHFKIQRNLSGTFMSASTPYVEGSGFYHSAFTNLHWLHHQRCSERVPPLIFNSSLHCSPKTTVHGCQK